jgi:cytochrome c peroxidase
MTVGNLHLTDIEENQIVLLMQTLTDGFTRPYPDVNSFGLTATGGGSVQH